MTAFAGVQTPTLPDLSGGISGSINASSLGGPNRGICSLSFQDRVFRFRTNPNEIWWTYELITKKRDTYGGQVIQLLGTRLGDLTVKIDIGNGGWPYLMQVVLYLRDMMTDQRNGNTALFEYTTRNWRLKCYSMNIPFQDDRSDLVREIELSFKVQEDVNKVLSKTTLDAALLRLQEGIYGPGWSPHNKYNDSTKTGPFDSDAVHRSGPGGPTYTIPNIVNNVNATPQGDNPGGLFSTPPGLPSIPGISSMLGGFGGFGF